MATRSLVDRTNSISQEAYWILNIEALPEIYVSGPGQGGLGLLSHFA